MRHGGQLLIQQLKTMQCDRIFSKPGQHTAFILDGLYENARLQTITCRHENSASIMAQAYGELTGKPGIAIVSGATGAINAAIGVHIAKRNSTPMLLLVGLPPAETGWRENTSEIQITSFFADIAKEVAVASSVDRIPEYMCQAHSIARTGRPGPVVLGVPEDILSARTSADPVKPAIIPQPAASPQNITALLDLLKSASRPVIIVGGSGWSQNTASDIQKFAATFKLPVATAFNAQDYFDNTHSSYIGTLGPSTSPELESCLRNSDLIIALGAQLDETTTGDYEIIQPPRPAQQLVHIHADPAELGRVCQPDLLINAASSHIAAELANQIAPDRIHWEDWTTSAHSAWEKRLLPTDTPGDVKMEYIVQVLNEVLEDDALITHGCGAYAAWLHRYRRYRQTGSRLSPATEAAEYALPAAIAAKLQNPARTVVAVTGDGGFMMTASELSTAMLYGLNIVVIIVNNRMFGSARLQQEQKFPGRVLGASISNPDFLKFAESFGAGAEVVEHRKSFRTALKRALKGTTPTVIDLRMDENALSPDSSLTDLRNKH